MNNHAFNALFLIDLPSPGTFKPDYVKTNGYFYTHSFQVVLEYHCSGKVKKLSHLYSTIGASCLLKYNSCYAMEANIVNVRSNMILRVQTL